MADKIEPALTPEEWADPTKFGYIDWELGFVDVSDVSPTSRTPVALIALANAALPDSDPRKITRETCKVIRHGRLAYPEGSSSWRELTQIAAALESYLPPEG